MRRTVLAILAALAVIRGWQRIERATRPANEFVPRGFIFVAQGAEP